MYHHNQVFKTTATTAHHLLCVNSHCMHVRLDNPWESFLSSYHAGAVHRIPGFTFGDKCLYPLCHLADFILETGLFCVTLAVLVVPYHHAWFTVPSVFVLSLPSPPPHLFLAIFPSI